MLQLNVSNLLSALAHKLSADMRQQPVSVFQPYYIVTQTEGMNNWLKLQIAKEHGIAANCIFLKPNDLIQQVYLMLGGRFTNNLSATNLSWLVYNILGEKEFNDRFRQVANYYAATHADKDIKRLALAEKITDLFDQYQIYRPDMIKEWNAADLNALDKEDWQQYLWKRAAMLSDYSLPDKTIIRDHIVNALKDQHHVERLQSRLSAIYMFGLSVTTAYHLNVFNLLAEKLEVQYYLLNPAPNYYWFDDKSEKQIALLARKGFIDKGLTGAGNPLLTNWGRVISDTFSLLFQNEELLNAYEETDVMAPVADTLLHKLQLDIFNNAKDADRNEIAISDLKDGSVTINSCYTITREVEVLYNYLVHLVDIKKEKLSPRDIVVMVTDIDAYAPYIKAVFANAPYKFRYTIADESFSVGDSMINALKSVLAMNRQNFKAEEVLQLLDSSFIRKRFGLEDLSLVRKVVDMANIRFGMEGRSEDDTQYVSWPYGIDRIMYGLCMSGDEAYNTGSEVIYPLDVAEGADASELVRFVHFVQVLMDSIQERRYDRPLSEWVEYVERVVQNLVCETEDDAEEEYAIILKELEKLNAVNELVKEKISFDIFAYSFVQSISSSTRTGSFAGGGITFCSLIPMRSIPFKVVALLGLSFDKFPRREIKTGFNLMELKRMKGDRNIKDNDKHLFLETILSAQQYLYMSYLGQSAKDNTNMPPSALLDELIDYIETGCAESDGVRKAIINRHPLHNFSRKYNSGDSDFYNYLDSNTVLIKQETSVKPLSTLLFDELSLSQFIGFFKHPFKEYYNKVLSIYYEDESVLLSDTELFDLDKLQEWNLKHTLLTVTKEEVPAVKSRLVKTGALPLKHMADISIATIDEEVEKVRDLFQVCVNGADSRILNLSAKLDTTLLKGAVSNVYDDKLVYVSYSKNEYKYLLDAYMTYLAATACGEILTVHFISATRQQTYTGVAIQQQEACDRLMGLLSLYKQGHESILAFHPLLKIDPADVSLLDKDKFGKMLKKVFENFMVPCEDRYLLNEYANQYFHSEDVVDRFKENCEKLVTPLAEIFPDYFN